MSLPVNRLSATDCNAAARANLIACQGGFVLIQIAQEIARNLDFAGGSKFLMEGVKAVRSTQYPWIGPLSRPRR